jgi:hypothetical protein
MNTQDTNDSRWNDDNDLDVALLIAKITSLADLDDLLDIDAGRAAIFAQRKPPIRKSDGKEPPCLRLPDPSSS